MKRHQTEFKIGGKPLQLEIGHVAEQANAAVMATYGETVVLVTVVAAKPRDDIDYFPLFNTKKSSTLAASSRAPAGSNAKVDL